MHWRKLISISMVHEPRSYLIESVEEAVDVISGWAGVQGVLVFLDLLHSKRSQLFNFVKYLVLLTWQPFHQPREDIVQLWWKGLMGIMCSTTRCWVSISYLPTFGVRCCSENKCSDHPCIHPCTLHNFVNYCRGDKYNQWFQDWRKISAISNRGRPMWFVNGRCWYLESRLTDGQYIMPISCLVFCLFTAPAKCNNLIIIIYWERLQIGKYRRTEAAASEQKYGIIFN